MNKSKIINYSGIFLTYYANNDTSCVHSAQDHCLIYLYSGKLIIEEKDKKEIVLEPGSCVFVRRNYNIKMTKINSGDQQYKGITMTLRRNFLRDFYYKSLKKDNEPQIFPPKDNIFIIPLRPDLVSLFHSLDPYFDTSIKPSKDILSLKEQEAILSLLKINKNFYSILFDFTEPWKIDILDFLNENYRFDLSMKEIALYTGRSLATFKRDFSKVSDVPPRKWIIRKRLEVAYNMLEYSDLKIKDVCYEVGFKNLSHFYKAFKKQYGFSPSEKH
ncbi:AraC family transcriptional regulator [uncultured Apibacter sp.]|uniref:helix-turn-helix domain-containing protein n=2 Tax=Apibacter TaxID=1778601 RepID=UPI0025CFADCF|nr:AraC family transcriptional regulator [uncultured Apibacter sp.]